MVDEASASETSVTMPELNEALRADETQNPNSVEKSKTSIEATIESYNQGGTESTCNNNAAENSSLTSDVDHEKSLEYADDLMDKGSKAMKGNDYTEATEYFSRALEIRASHYGELAPECVHAYYKYGCALLYKAQEEADPLADVPKKESESHQGSDKDGSAKNTINGDSSMVSTSSTAEQDVTSNNHDAVIDDVSTRKDEEEEDSDDEDLAEADEDESDLDLAWKMLDVARAIVEKHSGNTIEAVDILSALGEVALEREDIETSLSDYQKALSILEQLVEPDHRQIAELNFRICLCLEVGSKPQEAILYCQKAISVCKARVHRLTNEVKSFTDSNSSASNGSQSDNAMTDKEAEIETVAGLSCELEKKLEDLQQLATNPKSILSEILSMASAKLGGHEKTSASVMGSSLMGTAMSSSRIGTANSDGGFDSPTVSTAHSNGSTGVTHLGVVGRGVKRVLTNSGAAESGSTKKSTLESSKDKGDESAS
ncbi:Tetratricopeptide repeat (TPR)-like superfamily protein [Quillaja saponaria]|uniref:Tetratricopeptide repeat (TPR)-like superfamily protein n=1 Tax=Quillaja saponaria TaxID=32244 RepID=A0AAD7P6Y1_QUISA|nr:Tetratricopeptide repeat (TPR)-like superfamily protein [Quillaja saponaria]